MLKPRRLTRQRASRLGRAALYLVIRLGASLCFARAPLVSLLWGTNRKVQGGTVEINLLVVRLQGVLTPAEQHLVATLPAEKGRELLKQVRTTLMEAARPVL